MDTEQAAVQPQSAQQSVRLEEELHIEANEPPKQTEEDKSSLGLSHITGTEQMSLQQNSLLQTLEPRGIQIHQRAYDSFMRRHESEQQKSRKANEFVQRIRRQREQFEGKMFMIRKEEENQRRKRASMKEMDHTERSLEERKKKLGGIFQNLEEYESRKKRRQKQIEQFRHELSRLQKQKPLYQVKEEEYLLKHELPVIMERQARLEEVKQARKPIDWQRDIQDFQDRIFELKRQRPSRAHRPVEEDHSVDLYKSRFYNQIQSRASEKGSPDSKALVSRRRKEYSREVKYYIEPHMVVRARSNVTIQQSTPKHTSKETQQVLGQKYMQYCKGFNSKKRYKTQRTLPQEKHSHTESTYIENEHDSPGQEHSTISLVSKPLLSADDEEECISDIKVKLEMLRYLAK